MPSVSPLTVRVTADDGPVRVQVWPAEPPAPASAPVLLAAHAWTDAAEVFGPLAVGLGCRWTIVAPDAPGHGGTPLRPGPYVIADHAVSALAVLESLPRVAGRGRPVVAYGHSMGALTAARVAAARPDIVGALVLEDPARTTLRRPPMSTRQMRTWLRSLRSGDHAYRVAWAQANHPDWPEPELDPWSRSKAAVDLAPLDGVIDWGEPLAALLAEVSCPVVIVRGEPARGGIVSRTAAARCAAACSAGAQVLALPAGHSPRREAPADFVEALALVLSSVE